MTTTLQAAAIEFNTLHDYAAPVAELHGMALFDEGDDLYCTPVSGDVLAKVRKLGTTKTTAHLNGWEQY